MKGKNIQVLVVLLVMAFMVSGCAQMRDKFIRKPKEEETKTKRYYAVRKYDVKPSLDLYTKRYVFWKTWHKELLSVLGKGNHKKIVVAVEQEVSNLMDMQNMLTDEKAEELGKLVDGMTEMEKIIKKQKITTGTEVRIRKKLESLGGQIKRGFSYNKMRGYIRDDFRSE